jgi:hypothetical protein
MFSQKKKKNRKFLSQHAKIIHVTIDAKGPAVNLLTRRVSVIFSLVFSCGFLKNLELSKSSAESSSLLACPVDQSSSNRHAVSHPMR